MICLFARRAVLLLAALLLVAPAAWAQQRPLVTEDPETVGAGHLLFETGVDYERDVFLPWSGLRGDILSVMPFGVSIGVSSIAEVQFDAGFYQKMTIKQRSPAPFTSILAIDGDTTTDVDDLNVGMKFRFLSETAGRPAMGFRFSTKLPNASNESGLGKDVQDFQTTIVVGKTIQSVRTVANVGLQILGDPTTPAKQDDLLIFGLSVARAISAKAEIVGEYVGRLNFGDIITPGAEDRGAFRFGARFTQGVVRLDGALLIGATPRDPSFGFTAGVTWVLNAFKVP
ncbi:MAG: hypothetical protein ABI665_18270 [Vicinamibacterales bacterium]